MINVKASRQELKIDKEYIEYRVNQLKPWYHRIDLGNGIVTPGYEWDETIWRGIRKIMDEVDYRGKIVLDLGSWDGMWAFEAERRGAAIVIATDARLNGFRNLLFAKEILQSEVIPMCNVPVQELEQRLKGVGLPTEFDIIQHFGLFYHLRDPLISLAQCRRVMSRNGLLLLETAFIDDDEKAYMLFSGLPDQYSFYGPSDTWAPTKKCLKEILIRSFLLPINTEKWQYYYPRQYCKGDVARISLSAKRMSKQEGTEVDQRKVFGLQ